MQFDRNGARGKVSYISLHIMIASRIPSVELFRTRWQVAKKKERTPHTSSDVTAMNREHITRKHNCYACLSIDIY